jgi:hypothetical protein
LTSRTAFPSGRDTDGLIVLGSRWLLRYRKLELREVEGDLGSGDLEVEGLKGIEW